jgi:uncharacterized protein with PIN domain
MSQQAFIADVMVGKLARWLRVLGYDVVYSNKFEDDEILQIASSENRIILTRDVAFSERCHRRTLKVLFIQHNDWRSQLRQVLNAFDLKDFNPLSRCIECNSALVEIDKPDVQARVPPYVYSTQDRFSLCPSCSRIYWRGTHVDAILSRIPA